MADGSLQNALAEWAGVLGDSHVLADPGAIQPYRRNVTGLDRAVPAVLLPGSTEEVQQAVRIAARHKTPLYPISTGRNWGFGSRLPVTDGCTILDLRRMKAIREVSETHHYAVVEAGVTQGDLYDRITAEGLPLTLNVTGSGRDTSLIGNALERGIGYFASRAESLSGMEVVTGTGEILRTGFGHASGSAITHVYRHGIGPSLDGLFFQSNLGIVTAAGVDLVPAEGDHMAAVARTADPDGLAALVDLFAKLRREGVIQTVTHIGNRNRTEITLGPLVHDYLSGESKDPVSRESVARWIEEEGFGAWNAVTGFFGSPLHLAAIRKEIRRALRGTAQVTFLTDAKLQKAMRVLDSLRFVPALRRKAAMLHALQPLHGLSKGIPTDAAVHSVYWSAGCERPEEGLDPDQGDSGMIYVCPFIPAEGRLAARVWKKIEEVHAARQLLPCVTFNLVDAKALEAVISIPFNRADPRQSEAARRAHDELLDAFFETGYLPYRVSIQDMDRIVKKDDPYWQTVRELKRVFDPDGIIAPGRYNLG